MTKELCRIYFYGIFFLFLLNDLDKCGKFSLVCCELTNCEIGKFKSLNVKKLRWQRSNSQSTWNENI